MVIPSSFSGLRYLAMLPRSGRDCDQPDGSKTVWHGDGYSGERSGDYVAPMVKLLPVPSFDAGGGYPASSAARCVHGRSQSVLSHCPFSGWQVVKVIWEVEGPVSSQNSETVSQLNGSGDSSDIIHIC